MTSTSSSSSNNDSVDLAQFEEAVKIVTTSSSKLALNDASRYIEKLWSLPNSFELCMQFLLTTQYSEVRFFCLQAIERAIKNDSYTTMSIQDQSEFRQALIVFTQERGANLLDEATYVRTKLAVIFALLIKLNYPETWTTAFRDILDMVENMNVNPTPTTTLSHNTKNSNIASKRNVTTDKQEKAMLAGIDLFIRILSAIHEDLVDTLISRSQEDTSRSTIIKDAMRSSEDINVIVETLLSAEAGFADVIGEAEERMGQTPGSNEPDIDTDIIWVARTGLTVLASYTSWMDIKLVVNPEVINLYGSLLSLNYLRGPTVQLLIGIVTKGMDDVSKIEIIKELELVDITEALVNLVESTLKQGNADNVDPERPYGETGYDDDSDLGEKVATLVSNIGVSLLTGGTDPSLQNDPDACEWITVSLRSIVDQSYRLLELVYNDWNIGVTIMNSFFHEIVNYYSRERNPPKHSSSNSQSKPVNGNLIVSPDLRPLRSPTLDTGSLPPLSLGESAVETSPSKANQFKPAGISCGEFISRLLTIMANHSSLPDDFTFISSTSNDGGGDENEEEGTILDFRKSLQSIFIILLRIDPDDVLNILTSTILNPGALEDLSTLPWYEAEAILWLVYILGEGPVQLVQSIRRQEGILAELIPTVLASGVHIHKHYAVVLQYYEVVNRFHDAILLNQELIPLVLDAMLGAQGLQHPKPATRARVAYILAKLIRTFARPSSLSDVELLTPYCEQILEGVQEFLNVPFLYTPPKKPQRTMANRPRLGASGDLSHSSNDLYGMNNSAEDDSSVTRGKTGLGSSDAEFIFELVGTIIGNKHWLPEDKRTEYAEIVAEPLLNSLNEAMEKVSQENNNQHTKPNHQQNGSASWDPDFYNYLSKWIVKLLSAIGHFTKGLSYSSGSSNGSGGGNSNTVGTPNSTGPNNGSSVYDQSIVQFAETLLSFVLRAMALLPSNSEVRDKSIFSIRVMQDFLGVQLFQRLPEAMDSLLNATTSTDVERLLGLLQSLIVKYKSHSESLIQMYLLPVISLVFDIMPAATTAPTTTTTNGTSLTKDSKHTPLHYHPRTESWDAPNSSLSRSATGNSSVPSSSTSAAAITEETRSRLNLQKSYMNFLNCMVTNNIFTDVVLGNQENCEHLEDILMTIIDVTLDTTDPIVQKISIQCLQGLIKQWMPISNNHSNNNNNNGTSSAVTVSKGGSTSTNSSSSSSSSSVATLPLVTPLPSELHSLVLGFIVEQVLPMTFTLMNSHPLTFDVYNDAQCSAVIGESISLQLSICTAYSSGGGNIVPPNQREMDPFFTILGENILLSTLNIVPTLAENYCESLRTCQSVKTVKPLYIEISKYLRSQKPK